MSLTYNEIIRDATADYLADLDTDFPTEPNEVESSLLDICNARITEENFERADRNNKLPYLKTLTNAQIADIMLTTRCICRIGSAGKNTDPDLDMLAMYVTDGEDKGIYVTSEDVFRSVARSYNYSLTTNDFKEIYAALKDAAPRKYRNENRDLIAVNNGIFDYAEKTLMPFSAQYIFLSKSHVNYNENAENVIIHNDNDGTDWDVESWMQSLSDDPEIVNLLWEITGALIRPNVRWNKSAWLISDRGNNGKGTLCEAWRELCGPTTYASIPISDFSKDFQLEPLTRASAIIVDENDVGAFIDKVANLKAVVTNDVITINRKYKSPVAYQFKGFMVQCLNEFPRIKDKSESFYRRQLFVPMTKNFAGIERRYIKDDYLHRKEVLEYMLFKVLHEMTYYALSEPEATKEVLNEYKGFNDPVRSFWEEFRDEFVWDLLPYSFLYPLYRSWFAATTPSGSALGRNSFISQMAAIVFDDPDWSCPQDNKVKIRSSGRMDKIEPLILAWKLTEFYNPAHPTSNNPKIVCNFDRKQSYRGILRNSSSGSNTLIGAVDDQEETA